MVPRLAKPARGLGYPLECSLKGKPEGNEGREYTQPRATMRRLERKGVAGGASWKLLKTKAQICGFCCKEAVPEEGTGRPLVKEARLACISSDGRKILPKFINIDRSIWYTLRRPLTDWMPLSVLGLAKRRPTGLRFPLGAMRNGAIEAYSFAFLNPAGDSQREEPWLSTIF